MEKYVIDSCIGRGNYGSVHLIHEIKTQEKYVVKKIPIELMSDTEKEQAHREVDLLSTLNHPNIVSYRESFVENDILHIVMSYCEGGDLSRKIKAKAIKHEYFNEQQILDWFIQLSMAVRYMHDKRILHRDFKTSNIFLTNNNVIKIGDFGIARVLDSTLEQAKTVVGTPYYMSPEVCENKPYSYASDIWALGCVLYEMCTLKHAFDASNLLGLVFKIVQHQHLPIPDRFSKDMSNLVQSLLKKNPMERPTMRAILANPYIHERIRHLAVSGGSLGFNYKQHLHESKSNPVIIDGKDILTDTKSDQSTPPELVSSGSFVSPFPPPPPTLIPHHDPDLSQDDIVNVIPSSSPRNTPNKTPKHDSLLVSEVEHVKYEEINKVAIQSEDENIIERIRPPERSSSPELLLPPSSQLKRSNRSGITSPYNDNIDIIVEQNYQDMYHEECSDITGIDYNLESKTIARVTQEIPTPAIPLITVQERIPIDMESVYEYSSNIDDLANSIDEEVKRKQELHELEIEIEMDRSNAYAEDFDSTTSSSECDGEEKYYSDDFESDEDEILEYSTCSLRDMQEMEDVRFNATITTENRDTYNESIELEEPQINQARQRRLSFMERVRVSRERLQNLLGYNSFIKVYEFLKRMHLEGKTNCKKQLVRMVGRSKLHLCFEMDQLIYFEEMISSDALNV